MVVKSESVMGEILKKLPCEPPEIGGILGEKMEWSHAMSWTTERRAVLRAVIRQILRI